MALLVVAMLGFSRAATGDAAAVIARLGAALSVAGAAVAVTVTSIDGYATKAMSDAWVAAGTPTAFGDAVAVETVQNALFRAEAALFFGLPVLLFGLVAQLPDGGLPRRAGWLALLGGGGALVFGATSYVSEALPGLLFNVCAAITTAWALVTGVLVWRRTAQRADALPGPDITGSSPPMPRDSAPRPRSSPATASTADAAPPG